MRARYIAVIVAVGCGVGGCASAAGSPAGQQSTSHAQSSTQGPGSTTTVTVAPTTTSAPHTTTVTPAPTITATAQDPAAVVTAFYGAINAQDYATAWALGGDNLGMSYSTFAGGFAGTAHDTLTVTGVQGDMVQVHLEALQTDGSTKVYDGSYMVQNGKIVSGTLSQTGTIAATSPSAAPQGTITDPNGGFYARGEFCPTADAGQTTVDASGNVLTCVLESGQYHWH
jgi:hypothetical protein